MSLVKVQGNVNGTGTITVAAPNTNNTQTLTLPDLTATLAVNGPAFNANTVTAQSIPSSTFTKIQFNVKLFDTANAYDATTNYRFQPLVAGYYQVNGNVSFGGGSVGYCQISIYKNTSPLISGSGIPNNTSIGGMVTASSVIYLNGSTDYVEIYVWQNTGSSLALQTGTGFNTFSAAMVRAA
jgi:hypothetical protein